MTIFNDTKVHIHVAPNVVNNLSIQILTETVTSANVQFKPKIFVPAYPEANSTHPRLARHLTINLKATALRVYCKYTGIQVFCVTVSTE